VDQVERFIREFLDRQVRSDNLTGLQESDAAIETKVFVVIMSLELPALVE
jgi:hypothetical protein